MVSSEQWLETLPKPWELGPGLEWHVFISYRSDVVRVIDLCDALRSRGYRVLHEKHEDATADALTRSSSAILVWSSKVADSQWCAEQLSKLTQRAEAEPRFHHMCLDLKKAPPGPQGTKLLTLLYGLRGQTPPPDAAKLAEDVDRDAEEVVGKIGQMTELPGSLGPSWSCGPALGNRLAEVLNNIGRYQEGLGVLREVEKKFGRTLRGEQLKGVAQARWGHLQDALETLGKLYDEGHRDPETLGIYAGRWMDSYDRTGDRRELAKSRDLYAEAFRISPTDYYTGINAAAKSVFLRDREAAIRFSKQVQDIVALELQTEKDVYWLLATDAEAQLINGNYQEAARRYRAAVTKAPKDYGSQFSTWVQAKRLMQVVGTSDNDRERIWRVFRHLTDAAPSPSMSEPPCRRLRVFAFDPSMARHLETASVNEVTLRIPWEAHPRDGISSLQQGPVGEYLEVTDYDPASGCFYEPVDLDDQRLLAMDGLSPSEGDPKFHQQMVYAVAMNLIDHFERALGRRALWASHMISPSEGDRSEFVRRLRIYPHALREANAYYSPQKKAVLFGYFRPEVDEPDLRGTVFTCLSHDVVSHEISHALLDGLHPRFAEPSNPDVLAFHEAFADIVALFQHFSHSQVLRHEIARTRSDLATQNLLGQLAQQFGRAIGRRGALRDALGEVDEKTQQWRPKQPRPEELNQAREPHTRGSILVAAIFDAYLAIYQSRIADLLRIATQGSGVLAPGALHPDLVSRLADEAAKTATHFLRICMRALDYCPPVDITLGDYLRAIITADVDLVRDDQYNYRLAILEGFQRRGIYPDDVQTLSVTSLVWRPPRDNRIDLRPLFGEGMLKPEWRPTADRKQLWDTMRRNAETVQSWLNQYCSSELGEELGLALGADSPRSLYRQNGRPTVEVHSVRVARRNTPQGSTVTDLVVEIVQRRRGYFEADRQETIDRADGDLPDADRGDFTFYGGCTLLIDPLDCRVRYAITKNILSKQRLARERAFRTGEDPSLRATYFGDPGRDHAPREPFALLHRPVEA